MNEPPGARARVALSGLTLAENFRDGDGEGKGKDILFLSIIFLDLHKQDLRYLLIRKNAFCSGLPAYTCY